MCIFYNNTIFPNKQIDVFVILLTLKINNNILNAKYFRRNIQNKHIGLCVSCEISIHDFASKNVNYFLK